MTPVVQQAGEPRLRFESVLSELLARVDDDALVGRVQDAWVALLGSPQAGEPTDALAEVREWHLDQAMWHRHAAECGTAEDQSEPTRSMLLTAAALHERFAAALASRPQQPQAKTPLTDERISRNPGPQVHAALRLLREVRDHKDRHLLPRDWLTKADEVLGTWGPVKIPPWMPCMNCSCDSTGKITHCAGCPNAIGAPHPNTGAHPPAETPLTDTQRCIDARNRLWSALDGPGAILGSLEEAVETACHRIAGYEKTLDSFISNTGAHPPEAEPKRSVTLTGVQLQRALYWALPDDDPDHLEAEVTIAWSDGIKSDDEELAMEPGYVLWWADYPEEGCVPLGDPAPGVPDEKLPRASPPEARADAGLPAGFALVPIDPSHTMLTAAFSRGIHGSIETYSQLREGWAAMLAASPLPPEAQEPKT